MYVGTRRVLGDGSVRGIGDLIIRCAGNRGALETQWAGSAKDPFGKRCVGSSDALPLAEGAAAPPR
jgi:hypothetical protein